MMETHGQAGDEHFYSSKDSPLGKSRRTMWLVAAFALVVPASSMLNGSLAVFLVSTVGLLLFFFAIDSHFRRQMRLGQAIVILRHDAIESPLFSGRAKRFEWKDVVGVSIQADQGARGLQLQLDGGKLGLRDRRRFWSGRNEARPTLALSPFDAITQENLFAAVYRRLQRCRSEAGQEVPAFANALAEEREFQERLKALAPIPWMTWLLVALNVLVWGLTVAGGAGVMKAPADKLLLWGGNAASEVQRGEWWRLLSATFLHGGVMHLFMNMLGLASAGITVERIYGHRLFILIYLGAGLIGSGLSLHFSAQQAVSVGASGAVFGVMGALLAGTFQHRDRLPRTFGKQMLGSIGFFIIYALLQGFSQKGIDNAAHVGGLVGGALLAFVLPERFDMAHFVRHLRSRAITAAVIVLAATVALATTAPAAKVDQARVFAGEAALQRGFAGFDAAMKGLQQEGRDVKAGKLTPRESDDRSRSVHAPIFRKVLAGLSEAYLLPNDPRQPLFNELRRMSELILESLEMQSVYPEGSEMPQPADPGRMTAIEAELQQAASRFEKLAEEVKAKKQGSAPPT